MELVIFFSDLQISVFITFRFPVSDNNCNLFSRHTIVNFLKIKTSIKGLRERGKGKEYFYTFTL